MNINSNHASLNIAHCIEDEAPRLYYTIGGENINEEEMETYVKELRDKGLEILEANKTLKNNLDLSKNFKGYLIFIQKHEETDPDHTAGMPLGFNAIETLEIVNNVARQIFQGQVPIDDDAPKKMQEFINQFREFLDFYPAFEGSTIVAQELQILKEQKDILKEM